MLILIMGTPETGTPNFFELSQRDYGQTVQITCESCTCSNNFEIQPGLQNACQVDVALRTPTKDQPLRAYDTSKGNPKGLRV